MKKKLAALAMTTVMVLSLAGCGKKIEGDYTAEVDLTDFIVESIEDAMELSGVSFDYDWKGSVVAPFSLEISEDEYTLEVDSKDVEKSVREFIKKNGEGLYDAYWQENYDMSLDEVLDEYGYDSYWEIAGADSEDEYIDLFIEECEFSGFDIKESGDCKIKDDKITLEDCGSDDLTLTYDDGNLKGKIDLSEYGIGDSTKIVFEREDD